MTSTPNGATTIRWAGRDPLAASARVTPFSVTARDGPMGARHRVGRRPRRSPPGVSPTSRPRRSGSHISRNQDVAGWPRSQQASSMAGLPASRIMYIESKEASLSGPARIGRVTFSKTGRTIYYRGKAFHSLGGQASRRTTPIRRPANTTGSRAVAATAPTRSTAAVRSRSTTRCARNTGRRFAARRPVRRNGSHAPEP
jgi:hypothetical protein